MRDVVLDPIIYDYRMKTIAYHACTGLYFLNQLAPRRLVCPPSLNAGCHRERSHLALDLSTRPRQGRAGRYTHFPMK